MKRVPLLSKDPTSHATASSRSNMMAVQHTVSNRFTEKLLPKVCPILSQPAPNCRLQYIQASVAHAKLRRSFTHPSSGPLLGVGLLCNLMICSGGPFHDYH
jgi:hypothetical protein